CTPSTATLMRSLAPRGAGAWAGASVIGSSPAVAAPAASRADPFKNSRRLSGNIAGSLAPRNRNGWGLRRQPASNVGAPKGVGQSPGCKFRENRERTTEAQRHREDKREWKRVVTCKPLFHSLLSSLCLCASVVRSLFSSLQQIQLLVLGQGAEL